MIDAAYTAAVSKNFVLEIGLGTNSNRFKALIHALECFDDHPHYPKYENVKDTGDSHRRECQ
jgi:hypothetical protein